MTPRTRRRQPYGWTPVLAITLALASGCSLEPEAQDELVASWDSRHVVTYHYVSRDSPAAAAPATDAAAVARDAWLGQQEQAEAEERRRQDIVADRERRRQLDEQRRQREREEDAYRDWWWQNRRDWQRRGREASQVYHQQISRWHEDRKRTGEAEAERWRRASQPVDPVLLFQGPR